MANTTIKITSKNIKDRLKDETLDLSFCDLKEVPVREIALVKKATHLDLSNNLLTALPRNFVTLKQIVKLDLSHNMITEIPENFGEMTQLKYLDLYDNQISRLPLSLGELRNLRWLDLKENPLTNAVATVAGPCSNMSECQACARNVVAYLSTVKLAIEEEKLRRLNAASGDTNKLTVPKTEGKKKKKKKFAERESEENINKNGVHSLQNWMQNEDNTSSGGLAYGDSRKSCNVEGSSWYRKLTVLLTWTLLPICIYAMILKFLPLYDKQWSDKFNEQVHTRVKSSLRIYQRYMTSALQRFYRTAIPWTEHLYKALYRLYDIYLKDVMNVAKNKISNIWAS